MKTKLLISSLLALTLPLTALSSMAATELNLLGEAAPSAVAERTVTITPDIKYVNVQGGQIVKFDVDGKTFTWLFDGPIESFQLNQVTPAGLLDHSVRVYVSRNPLYTGS